MSIARRAKGYRTLIASFIVSLAGLLLATGKIPEPLHKFILANVDLILFALGCLFARLRWITNTAVKERY